MDITYSATFCSRGDFTLGGENERKLLERVVWRNQYGSGLSLELNLVWFQFNLEFYRSGKGAVAVKDGEPTTEWVTGTVQEFLGLTDEENAEVERRVADHAGLERELDAMQMTREEVLDRRCGLPEAGEATYQDLLRQKFEEDHNV